MALVDNRKIFTERINRIETGRQRQHPSPARTVTRLRDVPDEAPSIYQPRRTRHAALRGQGRGPVYLFAGFCAGLAVMGLLAGVAQLSASVVGG